jgi:hypothetical protein
MKAITFVGYSSKSIQSFDNISQAFISISFSIHSCKVVAHSCKDHSNAQTNSFKSKFFNSSSFRKSVILLFFILSFQFSKTSPIFFIFIFVKYFSLFLLTI